MVEVCTGKLEGVLSQHVMSAQFNSKCFSKFYPFFNMSWFIVIILNYYYCYYYTTLTLFSLSKLLLYHILFISCYNLFLSPSLYLLDSCRCPLTDFFGSL